MDREEEKKNTPATQEDKQANISSTSNQRQEDDDQHSYPGKMDQVEGRMNNGEIGGGLSKQDD